MGRGRGVGEGHSEAPHTFELTLIMLKCSFHLGTDPQPLSLSGKFKDDLTDDATDLTPENLAALVEWRTFYTEHKVGLLTLYLCLWA